MKTRVILTIVMLTTALPAGAAHATLRYQVLSDGERILLADVTVIDFEVLYEVLRDGERILLADVTVIDFESFEDRQNINGLNIGGVTLTNPTNAIVDIYDNDRFGCGYNSPTKSFSTAAVCGTDPIVGVFDSPQTRIALWGGDTGDDIDSWQLEAFDAPAGGASLGLAESGSWSGSPFRKLEISAPNIWRFEVRSTGGICGVCYDDLEFVPEPATVLLLGLGALALLRRHSP